MTAAAIQVVCRLKTPRVESRRHLNWIKVTQPCAWPGCQRRDIDPHHPRNGTEDEPAGMGITAGDNRAVPICRYHHDACFPFGIHRIGQKAWEKVTGRNLETLAQHLWLIGPEKGRV